MEHITPVGCVWLQFDYCGPRCGAGVQLWVLGLQDHTMGTQDDAATTGHVPAGIGGDAYGYGTATGAVVDFDDRGQLEPTWRHRVTRYASRADTVGTQVGPIGAITMFEDPVAPGIYRYVVEYVEYVNDEWVVRHHALDVIVKVEGSALSAPENLSTTYSEHNGQTRMSWDPPASTHPANMAIYETRRRNAKDVHDAYQTLGFSTNDEFVDHTVLSGQHYEYEVRAVGWDQSKGEYSDSAVAPPFPAPECIDDTKAPYRWA